MDKEIYIVYATTQDGVIVMEPFTNVADALQFEMNGIKDQIRLEYGDASADSKHLTIGFAQRTLHTKSI